MIGWRHKLPAGALYFALTATVIISILISAFILFQFTTEKEVDLYLQSDQLRVDIENDCLKQLYLSPESLENNELIQTTRRQWGVLQVITSSGGTSPLRYQQTALVGEELLNDSLALVTTDGIHPIALAGRTILKGRFEVPQAQFRRAYIEGTNFIGSKLVDGQVNRGPKHIPAVRKTTLEQINTYLNTDLSQKDSVVNLEDLDSLNQSFEETTIWVNAHATSDLSGINLKGNVVVYAHESITIKNNALLNQVIVVAPKIIVERGFNGNAQFIASEEIMVEERVELLYPSFLMVSQQMPQTPSEIVIGEKCNVTGGIMIYQPQPDRRFPALLSIDKESIVVGEVYSSGYLENKGMLKGRAYANKLNLSTRSSVYENHIFNATYDGTALPLGFIGHHWVEEDALLKPISYERVVE